MRDISSNKMLVTLEVNEMLADEINELAKAKKLFIEIKKYRNRRSLDANALMWECLGQISEALDGTDKWQLYLQMLKRYGKYTYICVKPQVVDAVKLQWRESEIVGEVEIKGKKAIQMLCYFGSSTYDSKEFSKLLNGVISEMREMGLQPPADEETERALERWEKRYGQHS